MSLRSRFIPASNDTSIASSTMLDGTVTNCRSERSRCCGVSEDGSCCGSYLTADNSSTIYFTNRGDRTPCNCSSSSGSSATVSSAISRSYVRSHQRPSGMSLPRHLRDKADHIDDKYESKARRNLPTDRIATPVQKQSRMSRVSDDNYVVEYYHADYPCFDPNCKAYERRLPVSNNLRPSKTESTKSSLDSLSLQPRRCNSHPDHERPRHQTHHRYHNPRVNTSVNTSANTGSHELSSDNKPASKEVCCGGCRRLDSKCPCCCHGGEVGGGVRSSGHYQVPFDGDAPGGSSSGSVHIHTTSTGTSIPPSVPTAAQTPAGSPTLSIVTKYETLCFPDGRSTSTLTRTQQGFGLPGFGSQSLLSPGFGEESNTAPYHFRQQQQQHQNQLPALPFGTSGQLSSIGGVPVVVPVQSMRRDAGLSNMLPP